MFCPFFFYFLNHPALDLFWRTPQGVLIRRLRTSVVTKQKSFHEESLVCHVILKHLFDTDPSNSSMSSVNSSSSGCTVLTQTTCHTLLHTRVWIRFCSNWSTKMLFLKTAEKSRQWLTVVNKMLKPLLWIWNITWSVEAICESDLIMCYSHWMYSLSDQRKEKQRNVWQSQWHVAVHSLCARIQ